MFIKLTQKTTKKPIWVNINYIAEIDTINNGETGAKLVLDVSDAGRYQVVDESPEEIIESATIVKALS